MEESGERKGFWGSTLSKLKSALSKTKSQISGSISDDEGDELVEVEIPKEEEAQLLNAAIEGTSSYPEDSAVPDAGAFDNVAIASESNVSARAAFNVTTETTAARAESVVVASGPGIVEDSVVGLQYDAGTAASAQQLPPAPVSTNVNLAKSEPTPSPLTTSVATVAKTAMPVKSAPTQKSSEPVDEEYLEDLEEKLIKADIGVSNVHNMVSHLRKESRGKGWGKREVVQFLKGEFHNLLTSGPSSGLRYTAGKTNIYLVVGVNGTGKTTSIGKLCWRFKQEGKRVLMAAGDTFRAAAESQLEIWSGRAGVDIVRLQEGADPGAVVFTALKTAKEENYDCLVIDTAGRLQNKTNLMAELGKIRGVVEKHGQGLPLECLLVLDASTGQNGLQQAKVFTEFCELTGVILTKLDGTAKGGVVFSIAKDLKIPVKLIGLGEGIDDLRDFEPELFVEALF